MAGRSSAQDAASVRVGAEIEMVAAPPASDPALAHDEANQGLLDRIRAVLAA